MNPTVRSALKITGLAFLMLAVFGLTGWALLRVRGESRLDAAVRRYIREVGPVNPGEYAPERVPAAQNIAYRIVDGAEALVFMGEEQHLLKRLSEKPVGLWSLEEKASLTEMLSRNEEALEILTGIENLTGSSFDVNYDDGVRIELPGFLLVFSAHRLLYCKAKTHLEKGSIVEALRQAQLIERIAASLQHESITIFDLVGLSVELEYLELIQEMMPRLDLRQIELLAAQFDHFDSMVTPLSMAFGAEGAALHQALMKDSEFMLSEKEVDLKLLHLMMLRFDPGTYAAVTLDAYADLAAASMKPFARTPPASGVASQLTPEWFVDELFIRGLESYIERAQVIESSRRLTRMALTLHQYRMANGAYPDDLSPFSSLETTSFFTGEPVQFVHSADGSVELSFPETARLVNRSTSLRVPRLNWKLPPTEQ